MNLGGLTQFPPAFERIGSITAPTREDALRRGYRPGLGLAIVSAGRFGFLKGDGLLDCAYPSAGHIEKAYLAEHPHNRARSKWAISFGPPSAAQPGRARRGHRLVRVAPENVRVNWVSVAWDSEFADQSKYQVTYNTVGPGILIETDGRAIRFGLDSTPGYRNIVLPLRQGVVMRRLSAGGEAYRAPRDGRLTDNWILLRGSSAFPDVPLLLVLKGNPVDIGADLADDGASSLTLRYESRVGHVIAATPFGMGAFRPTETSDPDLLKRSVGLCRFWSKALMAFITDCKECYRVDWPTNSVSILQEYDYRRLTDVWGSRAIPIAPYPPALCLAAQDCAAIKIPRHAVDLAFPTKYGPLRAVVGADRSEYRLPIPPAASRIPIPPSGESPGKREGRLRHRVAAHDGSKPLPRDLFPGFWSRPDRSSVDAACMLGVLAPIWPYLDATSRQALKANAREYLIDCLDDQELFARTALFQSIERTPADAGKLARPIWFERTEPYTRKKYLVSYTVPNVRREGRSVTDYEGLFTDLEWGNGLGLYGIYQMAQLSGDWEVVKRNWQLVKGIYGLFEMLQDWACMSVSGSEHGRRWTDTASYGGYIGFRELARHVGDTEARHDGVYLHAKHGAMR
ncbi:hypothetical protein H8D79_00145, partial [PVC group bacterium]|nr:hypothetical protein [PVC group bacterium]